MSHKRKQSRRWSRSGKFNRHHLKNKCRGGNLSTSNIVLLDTERHKAWHFLFGNEDELWVARALVRLHNKKHANDSRNLSFEEICSEEASVN